MSTIHFNKNQIRALLCMCFTIVLFCNLSFSQQGLKAEYYDGTNFDRFVSTNYVSKIDQSWLDTPPVPGINPQECSIRWTGKLKPGKSGVYSFSAQVDDGIRVWIDDKLIIDQWGLNDLGQFKGTTQLIAQQEYDLKVEYFNGMIEGEVRLLWKKHKEDLSWYEKMFGDGIKFEVIAPENFLRPEESIAVKKEEVKKKVARQNPVKKKTIATPVKKEKIAVKQKKVVPPQIREVARPTEVKPMVTVKEADKFIPKNIQFEKGKTIILESSYEELNAFVQFLKRHPHLNVKVEGHTDVVGDAEMNLILSKDRAKTITEYLVKKGIAERRIKSEGFGGTRPLVVPEKGKYHPANRRVVFIMEGLEEK